jgi:hypothetical protein
VNLISNLISKDGKPDFLTKIITLDGLIKDSNWDDLSTNTLDALEKRQEQDLLHA